MSPSSENKRSSSPKNGKKRDDFDLEPNPFEQSFSARPSSSSNARQNKSPGSLGPSSNESGESQPDDKRKSKTPTDEARPVLPPLSSISSPADPGAPYQWGFTPGLANSLRAGPLSPAMLAGPASSAGNGNGAGDFDPANFRTGLTPRTGMTPRTGLTPLVGGPFPNTPNTAAFMQNTLTITPNTLNAITGAMNGSYQQQQQNDGEYLNSATNAATTAANGLFLLSQAHQELTKREEAQARGASMDHDAHANSNGNPNNANGKRGTKRKPVRRSTRGRKASMDDDDDDDDDEDDDEMYMDEPAHKRQHHNQHSMPQQGGGGGGGGGSKRPETEEEKRKNFLERNRQAALKCRQRKKAWLAQLQAKVEFLQQENERLTTALVTSREEISRLSALVGGVGVGQVNANVGGVPVSVGVGVGKADNRNQSGAYGY